MHDGGIPPRNMPNIDPKVLSTVYHLFLDYGILATTDTTVTDLHHTLPLNYNLFNQRQLLATSYIATVPMHLLHLAIYGLMILATIDSGQAAAVAPAPAVAAVAAATSPTYQVYMASSLAIGSTCGFVHNAAHRRRHGLPIFVGIKLLQDAGLLLHPDIHAAHHQGVRVLHPPRSHELEDIAGMLPR